MSYLRLENSARDAIQQYAQIFFDNTYKDEDSENYIASPLGSWLLLAVLAGSTDFTGAEVAKARVEDVLGLSVEDALTAAETILSDIKGADLSVAAWFDKKEVEKAPRVKSWLLSSKYGNEGIPTEAELDAWASEKTHGLIEKFPIEWKPELMFLVATVIYTKFSWREPYDVVTAPKELASWGVEKTLRFEGKSVSLFEVDGNPFAVHSKSSSEGQSVSSITSLSTKEFSPRELFEISEKISSRTGGGFSRIEGKHLAERDDLDPSVISLAYDESITDDTFVVNYPAWEADSKHDLSTPELAYEDIAETLAIDYDDYDDEEGFQASQAAVAKYNAKGFEAAAITAFAMFRAAGVFKPELGAYRITLNYTKAFVANCSVSNIPAFTAVVKKAVEGSED